MSNEKLAAYCDSISDLKALDLPLISSLAAQSAEFVAVGDVIIDTVDGALRGAVGEAQVALWYLVDKLCKQSEVFIAAMKPRLLRLAGLAAPKSNSPLWAQFEPVLRSLHHHFDPYLLALIEKELRVGAPVAPQGAKAETETTRTSTALVAHSRQLRSLGAGFVQQRSDNARAAGQEHTLQVKTRDSLMAMRIASTFAPAMPEEIAVVQHAPDADAPAGYMQALPANHAEEYKVARRKRLRDVMEKCRQQVDAEEEKAKAHRTKMSLRAEMILNDIVMPEEFPRDEFGVKVGNFPEGVRFIRDAVRESGGALELSVIVQRVGTMAEKEAVKEFGNIREFINIHKPTFTVHMEHNEWIVRLTEDADRPIPYDAVQDRYSWEQIECPGCSRLLKGRNLLKHRNSRRCVGMQLSNGTRGLVRTAISELAYTARIITEKLAPSADGSDEADAYDDDDIMYFGNCIDRAGFERRFKLAAPHHFLPIVVAIRAVRDAWLRRRNAVEMSDIKVSWEDGPFVSFFAAVGRNIRRLPIPWIEMGDIIDMCRRFTSEVKAPFPPPPRAADPRIRLHNQYPALLFAESDEDDDDKVSDDEEMYSDDEAEAFVFAPPVSITETMMVAGRTRDTMKLNYRLRTAPPMQLTRVLQGDGTQTQQAVYINQSKGIHVGAVSAAQQQRTAPNSHSSAPAPTMTF